MERVVALGAGEDAVAVPFSYLLINRIATVTVAGELPTTSATRPIRICACAPPASYIARRWSWSLSVSFGAATNSACPL